MVVWVCHGTQTSVVIILQIVLHTTSLIPLVALRKYALHCGTSETIENLLYKRHIDFVCYIRNPLVYFPKKILFITNCANMLNTKYVWPWVRKPKMIIVGDFAGAVRVNTR
jgi:hypothetical protein